MKWKNLLPNIPLSPEKEEKNVTKKLPSVKMNCEEIDTKNIYVNLFGS